MIHHVVRRKPYELKLLKHMLNRGLLSLEEQRKLNRLQTGFKGEEMVDAFLKETWLTGVYYPDLILSVNGQTIQIDAVVCMKNDLYVFEIKNYSGQFTCFNEEWRLSGGQLIANPLTQLNRMTTIFRQFLQESGWTHLKVHAFAVFPNPDFTLFGAEMNDPIIVRSQFSLLTERMRKNQSMPSKQLLKHFDQQQIPTSSHSLQLPELKNKSIKTGLFCSQCNGHIIEVSQRNLRCAACGQIESKKEGAKRLIQEIRMLAPHLKITGGLLNQWSGGMISERQGYRYVHSR